MPKLTRLEANRQIIAKLLKVVERWPEQRFQQILENTKIVDLEIDKFYEESVETLRKLEQYITTRPDLKD